MPDLTPADEPAPVPPPVDALEEILNLVEEVALARVKAFNAGNRDDAVKAREHSARAAGYRLAIAVLIEDVRAAGVAEGRRLAEDEFDNRSTYELAGLVHRYLHVEAPDNSDPVQVAIEVLEEAIQDHDTAGALETRGVAEGRRQATEDLTTWLDQLAARLPQYNSELSVCTRRANAQVLGAYERAATIARSGLDRNPRCSTCGDTRGGPRGHETSECTWDMWRWPDLLAVPRDAPATEEITEERCDLPDEHEPHDYDVDAPAGEWRHCDGAAVTEATRG